MLSCCVCLESEADDATTDVVRLGNLPCGHVMCNSCLSQMHTLSCPLCRTTFVDSMWRRIYSCHGGEAANDKAVITVDSALEALRGFLHDHPRVYDLPHLPPAQQHVLHDQLMERIQQIGTLCPPTDHARVVQLCGMQPYVAVEMRKVLSDAHSVYEARRGTEFEHLPMRVFIQMAPPPTMKTD